MVTGGTRPGSSARAWPVQGQPHSLQASPVR